MCCVHFTCEPACLSWRYEHNRGMRIGNVWNLIPFMCIYFSPLKVRCRVFIAMFTFSVTHQNHFFALKSFSEILFACSPVCLLVLHVMFALNVSANQRYVLGWSLYQTWHIEFTYKPPFISESGGDGGGVSRQGCQTSNCRSNHVKGFLADSMVTRNAYYWQEVALTQCCARQEIERLT